MPRMRHACPSSDRDRRRRTRMSNAIVTVMEAPTIAEPAARQRQDVPVAGTTALAAVAVDDNNRVRPITHDAKAAHDGKKKRRKRKGKKKKKRKHRRRRRHTTPDHRPAGHRRAHIETVGATMRRAASARSRASSVHAPLTRAQKFRSRGSMRLLLDAAGGPTAASLRPASPRPASPLRKVAPKPPLRHSVTRQVGVGGSKRKQRRS